MLAVCKTPVQVFHREFDCVFIDHRIRRVPRKSLAADRFPRLLLELLPLAFAAELDDAAAVALGGAAIGEGCEFLHGFALGCKF